MPLPTTSSTRNMSTKSSEPKRARLFECSPLNPFTTISRQFAVGRRRPPPRWPASDSTAHCNRSWFTGTMYVLIKSVLASLSINLSWPGKGQKRASSLTALGSVPRPRHNLVLLLISLALTHPRLSGSLPRSRLSRGRHSTRHLTRYHTCMLPHAHQFVVISEHHLDISLLSSKPFPPGLVHGRSPHWPLSLPLIPTHTLLHRVRVYFQFLPGGPNHH